jgi:hypothetical protein
MSAVTFSISTSENLRFFWGIKYTTNVRVDDVTFKSLNEIKNEVYQYLNFICQPFPVLMENIRYLNLHIDNNNNESFDSILNRALNTREVIYLCDHRH